MRKEEEVRKTLKGMEVDNIGFYVINGKTTIALHFKSGANERNVKDFLSFYLDENEVLL